MTISNALRFAGNELAALPSSALEAKLLLTHVLNKTQEWLQINQDLLLDAETSGRFITLVWRRKEHIPLAYLTHQKEFYGIDFFVDERVLIPRPETEELVECALSAILRFPCSPRSSHPKLTIADIGTGSGCIAISLKKAVSCELIADSCNFYATDISADALDVAKLNAQKIIGRNHNITFLQGSLLEPLPEKVDLIVANLPYLSKADYKQTEPEIKKEPKQALIGGEKGNELINKLLQQAPRYLKPGGKVIYETSGGEVKSWPKQKKTGSV